MTPVESANRWRTDERYVPITSAGSDHTRLVPGFPAAPGCRRFLDGSTYVSAAM